MMFKNSTKLLVANFSIVWKLILYFLFVGGIIIGLISPFLGLISETIGVNRLAEKFGNVIINFNISTNPFQLFINLNNVFVEFFSVLSNFIVLHAWESAYIIFVLFFVFPFILGLADLPVAQRLFGYMSSLTNYSFVGSYIKFFGKSVKYQSIKTLLKAVFNFIIILAIIMTLRLCSLGGVIIYFMPFIIVSVIVVLTGLKNSFLAGWTPAIIVYDCGVFEGFVKGVNAVGRRFLKVFSTSMMIMLLAIAVNYLFGTFAFPLTIPLFVAFFYVFEMVMFFGSQGMRYYVDLDTVLSPKRLEELDKLKNVIHII